MTQQSRCPHCWAVAALRWTGWHFIEITLVAVPVVLAVLGDWSWLWLALAALIATGWAAHEYYLTRTRPTRSAQHVVTAAAPHRAVATTDDSRDPSEQPKEASA